MSSRGGQRCGNDSYYDLFMNKLGFLKNISIIIAIIAVVYIVANYSGLVKSTVMQLLNIPGSSVAGVSTKRAEEISGKISSDVQGQFGIAQEKVLSLTLSDAINSLSRLKKIQQDFNSIKDYSEEQIRNLMKVK